MTGICEKFDRFEASHSMLVEERDKRRNLDPQYPVRIAVNGKLHGQEKSEIYLCGEFNKKNNLTGDCFYKLKIN